MPTDITADNLIRAAANGAIPFMAHPADKFSAAMDAYTYPFLARGAAGATGDERYKQNVANEVERS
jgi:hypothetical protein